MVDEILEDQHLPPCSGGDQPSQGGDAPSCPSGGEGEAPGSGSVLPPLNGGVQPGMPVESHRNLTRFCIHHIVNNKIAFHIGRVSFHQSTYESVYDCNSECIDWQFGAMIFRCLWIAAL